MFSSRRYILAFSLLLLFLTYWSSITLFPHVHHVGGHVYVHSHPVADSSQNHTHTTAQLQILEYLSLLQMTVVSFAFAHVVLAVCKFFYKVLCVAKRQALPHRLYGLRAPPVCGFSF